MLAHPFNIYKTPLVSCSRRAEKVEETSNTLCQKTQLSDCIRLVPEVLIEFNLFYLLSSGSDTSPSASTAAPEEEEAPVQGPLPAEPDDAPWKRNSGIRKL